MTETELLLATAILLPTATRNARVIAATASKLKLVVAVLAAVVPKAVRHCTCISGRGRKVRHCSFILLPS